MKSVCLLSESVVAYEHITTSYKLSSIEHIDCVKITFEFGNFSNLERREKNDLNDMNKKQSFI